MSKFVVCALFSLVVSVQGGLFDPVRCSDGYQDISSVLLHFDRYRQANQSRVPFTRGPQMRCVGQYCNHQLHAAICLAEQMVKKHVEAYEFDCQAIGIPLGLQISSYELDCEEQIPRSVYKICAYKGSCVLEYELSPVDLAVKRNVFLLSLVFIVAIPTAILIYLCTRFLKPFFPQQSYAKRATYSSYDRLYTFYKQNEYDIKTTQLL